jgi:hypothetical protein
VGVLERALVAKESSNECKGKGKMLGDKATTLDMSQDYELWAESLREALEEEESQDENDEGEEDDEEEDGIGELDGGVDVSETD